MDTTDTTISVACYARMASFTAPVDSSLRTLERLESEGVIDELEIHAWPAEVRIARETPHSDAVDRFREFDAWAEQWGVSIRPPFAVEIRDSSITGRTREVLITPVQCLAVHVDGTLEEVFPHSTGRADDAETYTVRDAIALLEARAGRAFGTNRTTDRLPSRRAGTSRHAVDPP